MKSQGILLSKICGNPDLFKETYTVSIFPQVPVAVM